MISRRLRSRLLCLGLLFCATSVARAQWVEKSSTFAAAAAPGLIHRVLTAQNSSGEVAEIDLAEFNLRRSRFRLRLIDNGDRSRDLAEAMQRSGCLAGTNGGYFDPDFMPIGLRIANGSVVRPLRKARLLTGIIVGAPGSVRILRLNEYSLKTKAEVAVQCGPLLVDGGHPVKGLERTRLARRTVAVVAADVFALGICSEVSLADAGEIMSVIRPADNAKVSRALNLDGGSSTAFWFKSADGKVFSESENKTVRDFLGIAAK
jgi:uncharacterized protein YigE (DUF2233 family)